MKKRKGFTVLFLFVLLAVVVVPIEQQAEAATMTVEGFTVDETLYNIKKGEPIILNVCAKHNQGWGAVCFQKEPEYYCLSKGETMCRVEVTPIFFTSKKRIDGCYYQGLAFKCKTVGRTVCDTSKSIGYPQYVTVKVSGVGGSPLMCDLSIEPKVAAGKMEYSIDGATCDIGVDITKQGWKVGSRYSLGITANCSWEVDALDFSTRSNDGGHAYWEYDYITSSKNKKFNIFCYSDVENYGLLTWHGKKDYSYLVGGFDIYVTAEAGVCKKNSTTVYRYKGLRTMSEGYKHDTINYR